ncbi:type I restriction enzyme endonuclease domain-containing protein [Cyanobium gracile]|uniref:type I restriction enzyme endonuclease domain-containing protein n=1 Tax=Cyanobium gracile TaxID=59930 RepID=UPI0005B8AD9C|nr:type I restriction enzyme endonuclease domain-containing protein [Cyanobium gracile]
MPFQALQEAVAALVAGRRGWEVWLRRGPRKPVHERERRGPDRMMVKRILNNDGYPPPDLQEEAVKTVLAQAELLCAQRV